jgi:hypothetical protein
MRFFLLTILALALAGCAPMLSSTSTPAPSSTPTAIPTHTATATILTTHTDTSTPRPTQPPNTATSTATATVAPFVPINRTTLPFDVDSFIKSLREAHVEVQSFKDYFARIIGSGETGDCLIVRNRRANWYGAFAYADVPPAWQALYFEYIHLLDGAINVTMPLGKLCETGGGTLDDPTDQQILSYVEFAQQRLYEMTLEADALKASQP